jgi:hypothetical protein
MKERKIKILPETLIVYKILNSNLPGYGWLLTYFIEQSPS